MRLAVNIDHIATLRNARCGREPDPVIAAKIAERAGAECIVCHLREDRRHINDDDLKRLRKLVTTKLDLEMAATPEIIRIAKHIKPDLCTLVPEHRRELTTEGGLNVVKHRKSLKRAITNLHASGIKVSLFIDPITEQINATQDIGADMMEIHTGEYANANDKNEINFQLARIKSAAKLGKKLGLIVNAGHGLDYKNIKPIAKIPEIDEVSIGYAIIVESMFVGLENAIRKIKKYII
jgi:pyridoxine 5-phosphate synthase